MTTATLTHAQIQRNAYRKSKAVELPRINWMVVFVIGAIACSFLLFFYIYQINVLTKGTYLISNYKNSIDKILEENKKLEVNFAENSFLGEVLIKTRELNFEKTTAVKYIQVLESSLAKAK